VIAGVAAVVGVVTTCVAGGGNVVEVVGLVGAAVKEWCTRCVCALVVREAAAEVVAKRAAVASKVIVVTANERRRPVVSMCALLLSAREQRVAPQVSPVHAATDSAARLTQ
jgi:hypothetical protein